MSDETLTLTEIHTPSPRFTRKRLVQIAAATTTVVVLAVLASNYRKNAAEEENENETVHN